MTIVNKIIINTIHDIIETLRSNYSKSNCICF